MILVCVIKLINLHLIDTFATHVTRDSVRFQSKNYSLLEGATILAHIPVVIDFYIRVASAQTTKGQAPL